MFTISSFLKYTIISILLFVVQVLVCNNIYIFDVYNPMPYVLLIFAIPLNSRAQILLFSFFLGLAIDFASNTGGINAFAITFVAYARELVFKVLHVVSEQKNHTTKEMRSQKFSFWLSVVLLILIHHTIIFMIEKFSFDQFSWLLLKQIMINTALTTALVTVTLRLFKIQVLSGEE